MNTKPEILFLCPQERDRRAVRDAGLDLRYRVAFCGEDLDRVEDFDPAAFVEEAVGAGADGVAGTKDRSALLAAIVAERLGLPGPQPAAVVACQHKPTSRAIQRRVAPQATPRFSLLRDEMPFSFPFFVKPVLGRLSQGAAVIAGPADLESLDPLDEYADRHAAIARIAGLERRPTRGFLAEELLSGLEVTLEGYVRGGRVTTIGITDSVTYPGTISFERFEYPTRLGETRRAELARLAEVVVLAHRIDDAFFNLGLIVPREGPAQIVELNARLATQFAPLVHRLHGRSTYDALFDLVSGRDPAWSPKPGDGFGVSQVVRVFEDALVEDVPEPEDDLEILVRPGLRLSEQGTNDARSYRLAILYGFGETRDEAVLRSRERARSLSFRLSPAVPAA